MKIRFLCVALAALFSLPAAWGQAGGKGGSADAPTKIGVINVQVAITSTAEGKEASLELQSEFAPRQTELETLQKEIADVQTRARNGASTLSDDEKARLQRENDTYTRTYQRKQQDLQDDANDAQRDVVDRIGRKMLDIVDKYSRENGFAVIIDTSAQNTPVVYASNSIDITQDIVRLYDTAYPVKAGATSTPKAPAPKPATPKP